MSYDQIILASQSPRRQELLSYCNVDFISIAADVDETIDDTKPIQSQIVQLAQKKAQHILAKYPNALVIGSDTVVVLDQVVMGKPKDAEDAKNMLRQLSGKTHQVITGVALCSTNKSETFVHCTEVTFFLMSEVEIEEYVGTGEPLDKAGAYGIQGKSMIFIKEIKGDYYSVMGLPVSELYQKLKGF